MTTESRVARRPEPFHRETAALSADRVSEADACAVGVEFLHTLNPPNFPAHRLKLKKGMPLMPMRNISPTPRPTASATAHASSCTRSCPAAACSAQEVRDRHQG